MSQVPTMDTDKERGGRDSRRSEARLSDSLEFLDRQSSLQIKQSRQSNERLIQEYRNNDNNNLPKQRWSPGQVTQINNSYRDSGNSSQPKYFVQDMNTTTVERHDDPEKSVFTSFPGYVADDTKQILEYDAGQAVSDGTAGRPLRSRWANHWVEQLDDISKEPAPIVRLQPIGIELKSQPMAMPVERMTQSSDPNSSLSSGDVPMAMSHWLEEQDWRRQCEREEHRVRRDTSSYQTEVITDQQPRDHNSHVGTRRRIKSAGPVMSGASRFGWTTSDEEGDRGRSLSVVTDPKRSLRRQWTTEWVGQPGYRNERKSPSSRSLPPIRIQGEFRPVNRQRSDPYWTEKLENRNEGYTFPSSRSLPPTHKQAEHQPVSRRRSDPYWTGQLENRNEGYNFPSSRSMPPTHKQAEHQPVSRQRSDPQWTGQLENRNEGYNFPSSRSLQPVRKQEQGEHQPASRHRSDQGTRQRNSSNDSYGAPMTVANWLENCAWSRHSHVEGSWRYPLHHREDKNTHWQPRDRRRARSADPLLSLHMASRGQQTQPDDESGRGQGYRHPSPKRHRSRSKRRSDPEVRVRTKTPVNTHRKRSPLRYSSKRYPQPPKQAPVKARANDGGTEKKEESKNPEDEAIMGWMDTVLLRFRTTMSDVLGTRLAGDQEGDTNTRVNSDGQQDDKLKNNAQEKRAETPAFQESRRSSLAAALFGALLQRDGEDGTKTTANSVSQQDAKENTQENITDTPGAKK